ncbi:amino acid--tRNA ligase-related protein [Desulfurobacterium indicum]|uniref:Elongation factor P--(R)-beta-lysine ligase n=1 Tax=Desulfurobacterium indicum TaxID=1914305 RepID=A0A1R1MLG5_9BACT|nr:amino acid--tRNA ligase-related protein [Desulfurobacterium indicum]OMH40603.1 elongation factor P--(R)-beta-lysine ligase [Desulfurobacterium indicum]
MVDVSILRLRDCLLNTVRQIFRKNGFMEVETPVLVPYENPDDNVDNVESYFREFSGKKYQFFLHTSPEFFMKRLIWHGADRIFQICKVFRDGEIGFLHNVEFTMVEWYRKGGSYYDGMRETEEIVRKAYENAKEIGFKPDFSPVFEKITVEEAFREFAGIDVFDENEVIAKTKFDNYEDAFFYLLVDKVEKGLLKIDSPVFLYDYPEKFSAMAKIENGKAERFELYIGGVEIANGYSELTDYESYIKKFLKKGGRAVDKGFLKLLKEKPLPKCEGVALGFDRLLMKVAGKESIRQVIPFTVEELVREVSFGKAD